jgi:hypothetical protein
MITTTDTHTLVVLSPEPTRRSTRRSLAPRREDLAGATVGLLDNNKPGAAVILHRLGELLRERGAAEVTYWCKALPSGPSPYVEEAGRHADVVISGVGDCGSCSSWSLRDAVDVELTGKPTVTLVSEPFRELVKIEAGSLGVPAVPIFAVPHPMATLPEQELRALADGLVEPIVDALTA